MTNGRLIYAILILVASFFCSATCFSKSPPVELKFREMRFGKPPLIRLYFDGVLRNDHAETRWFLLPTNLDPHVALLATTGGIHAVETFAPQGRRGRIIIGNFLGTGGFQALLLPAGAKIRLQFHPMTFWMEEDIPDKIPVEVVVAKRLTLGGKPAEAWFEGHPLSSLYAEGMEAAADHTSLIGLKRTDNDKEIAVSITEESRFKLQVSLQHLN